jgi:transcriptional regulator of arginine metabolism
MLPRPPELNRDFAIHHLTDLHNQRYFMQVCDENATIMHLLASERAQTFGLVWFGGGHRLKPVAPVMLKRERQKKLLNLIRAKRIGTQEALRAHLERAGVPATQSSLSRDLEELGVVKNRGAYALPHANGDAARGLLSLDLAGDVLVIARCLPGRASAVAVEIDDAALPEIVGTLAGEDTIFIAVRDQKAQRGATKKIWELFG